MIWMNRQYIYCMYTVKPVMDEAPSYFTTHRIEHLKTFFLKFVLPFWGLCVCVCAFVIRKGMFNRKRILESSVHCFLQGFLAPLHRAPREARLLPGGEAADLLVAAHLLVEKHKKKFTTWETPHGL